MNVNIMIMLTMITMCRQKCARAFASVELLDLNVDIMITEKCMIIMKMITNVIVQAKVCQGVCLGGILRSC